MILKIKCVLLLLLLLITKGYSQNLGLKHYTVDDGLPSNNAFNLFFDSKGYMWVATDKGIARYNGITFKTFTMYDGLPDNEVFGFVEDHEGRIWIANFKGVLCYYKDNVFHTASNTPWLKLNRKSSSNFFHLYSVQKDGSILTSAADEKALLIINHKTTKILSLEKILPQLENTGWRPLLLRRLNENRIQLFYTRKWFIIDTLSNILETQFYKDTSKHYWVISKNTFCLGASKQIVTPEERFLYTVPQYDPTDLSFNILLYIQNNQNLFMLSRFGVYHNQTKLLNDENYTALAPDNMGNIWLSSMSNGIFFFNKNFQNSLLYKSPIDDKIVLSRFTGNKVQLLNGDGGSYIISNDLKSLPTTPRGLENYEKLFTKSNTCITPSGDVLSVQKTEILYKKWGDKNYRKFAFSLNSLNEPVSNCKSINYLDSTFFISTACNIIIVKFTDLLKANTLFVDDRMVYYKSTIQDRIYHSALRLSDKSLWFSQSEKMSYVKNKMVIQEKKLQNSTFRQFEFYKNYLVGFTDDNKLFIYNTASKKKDSITEPNCIWEALYSINDSTLIVNTNNTCKLLILHPSLKDGRPRYTLTTIENPFIPKKADYIFGNDSTYYFLKNGKLSGFPLAMVAAKPLPPKPIFVSVKTEGKTYAGAPFINLPYNESKAITVQIDNVSFNNDNPVTQYSLSKDGNGNWHTITGNEINVNAIGTSYGEYVLKLRSKTSASDFSKSAVLTLNIARPFWAKWWFIALSVIFFILLILAIIRLIIWRQLRKKQKEFDSEMKYQQSEYKALNALMNPHFIFNSLNNIQGLINKDYKETANQYLVIFSKLIRQNMLNISKGYITLYQEMILIENYLYLEKLRFKELVNFSIEIDPEVDTEGVMIPPLLIQPLVENAILHGMLPMQSENSKLYIRIFEVADVIHVEVEDNGIGLTHSLKKKNETGDSYGLSNLYRRIEHVKKMQKSNIEFEIKELVDNNGKILGTKACITIEQG